MNRISVVIAMFNSISTIDRAVQSVLNQSYKKVDIIIVDDGSVDDSFSYVKKMYDKNDSIKIFRLSENKGAAYAKTFGVSKVNTEYFIFLDSDDEFSSINAIKIIMSKIAEEPDLICADSVNLIYSNDRGIVRKYQRVLNAYDHLMRFPFNYIGTNPFVFKKKYFLEVGGFDEELKWGDGLAHIRRYLKKYSKIIYLEEPIYNYYLDNNNISKKNKNYRNYLTLVKMCRDENLDYLLKHPRDRITWSIILFYLFMKDNDDANKRLEFKTLANTGPVKFSV
jgi:glycosyltransferase involved in cell wall biosynthesis